jgi:hypothetical protein
MTAGLRAHRLDQVFVADNPAGLAADHLQLPHGQVHPVLSVGTDVVIWPGCDRELPGLGTEQEFEGRQLRLIRDQRQHDHLAGLLLLPGDQVVDRLQLMLLVHRQQVHVQDEQIASHAHHFLQPRRRLPAVQARKPAAGLLGTSAVGRRHLA